MTAPGRVLVCVDYFHPSVGGSERLAEGLGVALGALGWEVEIATRALPDRHARRHRGMRVHEIAGAPAEQLRALVSDRGHDAVVALSAPIAWPVLAALHLPPGPRVLVVPCVNPEIDAHLRASHERLAAYRVLLERADAVGHSSLAGPDARLNADLDVPSRYLPNAAETPSPSGSLRRRAGVAADRPLLLVVGNLWPEKNHAGLLRTLAGEPGDWELVLVGRPSPAAPSLRDEVAALATADGRVTLVEGADPPLVHAGMEEADLLLLPSTAEATPLVLLEAMTHGLPWIATPQCGAAHDHDGGRIARLETFPEVIRELLADPAERARLGEAGAAHVERAYAWPVVAARYDALLRGDGCLTSPSSLPAAPPMRVA